MNFNVTPQCNALFITGSLAAILCNRTTARHMNCTRAIISYFSSRFWARLLLFFGEHTVQQRRIAHNIAFSHELAKKATLQTVAAATAFRTANLVD
jgi:predicted fused transcriptional regulator/phosphomethylpyrimidine kinase